jgi:hypothetical protein
MTGRRTPRRGRLARKVVAAIIGCTLLAAIIAAPAAAGARRTWIGIYPRLYDPDVDTHYYRHPHGFSLDSSDQDIRFIHLRWNHWGARTAVAVGRAKACGEGDENEPYDCESRRVRLVAGDRGSCPTGGYLYQRLVVLHAPSMYGARFEVPLAPLSCGPP